MVRLLVCAMLVAGAIDTAAAQLSQNDRGLSRTQNRLGWDYMKAEKFEEAVKAFQLAVETDPTFEMPFYGLGRAHMALKQYVSAISALTRCRDLYVAQVGRNFSNQQDAQRYRNDRIIEIDEMIRQVQTGPQTQQTQNQLRQLQDQKRQLQDVIARGNNFTLDTPVPSWVSLSLGSAYFRSGKLADAEREYKAAIETDRKSGEAYSNLAVVYLETARFDDAFAALQNAKKSGFRVNPQLEKEINDKRK
jgi:tetratricopeptide (TPR) repeat protein